MNQRRKVLGAYRAVLRWLHQNQLHPGDRLPPQARFGKELGICQGTLSQAMQALAHDQVIIRKQKAGTVLLNLLPVNPHRRVWTVGIVMPEFSPSGYFAALNMQLHRELASRNFANRTYFISPQSLPSYEVDFRQPSDFLGLEDDIEEENVDGLISCTRLRCNAIPCVSFSTSASSLRISFDSAGMLERTLEEFTAREVQQVFLVGFTREELQMTRKMVAERVPEIALESLALATCSEWAGIAVADEFIKRHDPKKRSGVIIKDDLMAAIFAREVSERLAAPPLISLSTYHGSYLSYPLPTLQFIINLQQISRAATDMLLGQLLGLEAPEQHVSIPLSFQEVPRVSTPIIATSYSHGSRRQ